MELKSILHLCVSVALFLILSSQRTQAVQGQLFGLAFFNLNTTATTGFQEIFVSSFVDTLVRVSIPALGKVDVFQLNTANGHQKSYMIPQDLGVSMSIQTGLPLAVMVSSQYDISVQANKAWGVSGGDGYLALPAMTDFQTSYTYYIASYSGPASFIGLVAYYNDTCIAIEYVNGTAVTRLRYLTMQENQVFQGWADTTDYTGIRVKTSKVMAVYGGQRCANIPVGSSTCDHLIEQLPSTYDWGTSFIAASVPGRDTMKGLRLRVVSQAHNTTVTWWTQEFPAGSLLGPNTAVIDEGNFYEISATTTAATNTMVVTVTCSAKCLVVQYDPSRNGDTAPADPFMTLVPPIDHYTNQFTFSTSRHLEGSAAIQSTDYVTVIVKRADVTCIQLDSMAVTGTWIDFTTGSGVAYSVISLPITPGFHQVTCSNPASMFTVFVSGHGPDPADGASSFGYLGGYKMSGTNVMNGSWFDFTVPSVAVTTPAPTASPTSVSIASSDIPPFSLQVVGNFSALTFDGKLISRLCSEGYATYFKTVRMTSMLARLLPASCDPGVAASMAMNISNYLYYNEYSRGVVSFSLTFNAAVGAGVTFDSVRNCAIGAKAFVTQLRNWVDNSMVYTDSTQILQRYTDQMSSCPLVHFEGETFLTTTQGWACPEIGALNSPNGQTAVRSTAVVLAVCWLLGQQVLNLLWRGVVV